ncbi:Bidirectional sugar transporter SWEET2a [Hibiscus syriacus]|uniref:Bidirectional sugar transporter SWEET2a n=1 Tax=Hibiscus syriacus TaxID=106335 RepID=A0A6A3A9G9_HIBSY|nr:Bidirectional sugar transporter SWEET2a [Hibiscus syriacus]
MYSIVVSSVYAVCSDAAGVAGNIFAFVLFLSPVRIIRNGSTEQFSGMPYIYALLNCLICLWYGLPLVSPVEDAGFLVSVSAIFAAIVFVSLRFLDAPSRQHSVGYLSVASLISMFASPLLIINLVIKTRSVEYMPFSLSLATFLMSLAFFVYGMSKHDAFIYVPNGIGTGLGTLQLALYAYFNEAAREELKHLLIGP